MNSENGPEDNPVAEDLFWGTLAILAYALALMVSGITHWWWWYLLAAGGIGVCLVMEVLRFRVPLLPQYKSARRVSLFIICAFLSICIGEIVRTFL